MADLFGCQVQTLFEHTHLAMHFWLVVSNMTFIFHNMDG